MTGKSILFVEDDRDIRTLLADFLAREGFVVEVAEDGAAADRVLARTRPDLVIHVSGALPDPRLVLARIERRRDVDENRTGAETVSESPVRSPAVPLPPPSSRP